MTVKKKKYIIKQLKEKARRVFTGSLAVYFLLTSMMLIGPITPSYALTGGPSQPEVQSFEPIGTSEMVDVFSGDFNYNIPLLDVEGYPINLSYHSGITMDQESSWTGLGWNVNVGTINRSLRGVPDDFNGDDKIRTETSMKPNRTVGVGSGLSLELFGLDFLGFSADLGISYNNYNGIGVNLGGGLNVSALGGHLNGGLGISSSSDNGLSISPSVSLSAKKKSKDNSNKSLTTKIGSSFNSRGGMKKLSVNSSYSKTTFTPTALKDKKGNQKFQSSTSGVSVGSSYGLGTQTYVPSGGVDMKSFSIAGRFKLGMEVFGADGGVSVDASYMSQWIADRSKDKFSPAYGYFHSEKGQMDDNAIMDFNREKDGSVSIETPALPLTNFTYDLFSVSGQGVGGSYRGLRGDVGYVSDPKTKSTSSSVDLSAEVSPGAIFHGGANVGVVISNSKTGKWKNKNKAKDNLKFKKNKPYADFESYYLREANEMSVNSDPAFFDKVGGDKAARFKLNKGLSFNTSLTNELAVQGGSDKVVTSNYRTKRSKRNSLIQMLTIAQVKKGMGMKGANSFPSNAHANTTTQTHHIGEISSLGTDGMRYIYGLPAYNTLQEEVTFSVGQKTSGSNYNHTPDLSTGLIMYNSGDDSKDNEWGIDNYFQKKTTPEYAHSYLLTAVVSPDYVDLDNNGPSKKDLGSYTLFDYDKVDNYKWRTPFKPFTASYSEGLNTDAQDDKANYIYGEKELWYLNKIETKNYVAIFEKEDRLDGFSVAGRQGGQGSESMQQLKSITLYAKPDYDANGINATELKKVHFVYSYDLCKGVHNRSNYGGKLTLKQVYFTYRDSKKGKLSPYKFHYPVQTNNPDYNMKGYDRWGNYKPNNGSANWSALTGALSCSEYPYVDQGNTTQQNNYAGAWSLSSIDLPSGGSIEVDLESDDYSSVQHKDAMQMMKIVGVGDASGNFQSGTKLPVSVKGATENRRIFFELDPSNTTKPKAYTKGIDFLYFRCLMQFMDNSTAYDYVSGYGEIEEVNIIDEASQPTGKVGYIDFKAVSKKDPDDQKTHSPIAVASAQFGRLHLSQHVWGSPMFDDSQTFGASLVNDIVQVFINFIDGFKNPNQVLFDKGRAINLVTNKSWLRLNNVNHAKKGGGCRVASIAMVDNWDKMTANEMINFDYGQEYDYTEKYVDNGVSKTRSSGVATYEPQIGGDENPWRQPFFYDKVNMLAPDDKFYQEEPFGESFFPSASVGYGHVTVKNLQRQDVTRHATGEIHHEFYTSRDFPTITKMTGMDHSRDNKSPFSILSIFNFDTKDYFTASQGFVVELNDMNGKPKSQKVYQENKGEPITQVEYFYKSELAPQRKKGIKSPAHLMDVNTKHLQNTVSVVYKNGTIANANIGVVFDAVADFRESKSMTIMPSINGNLDVIPFPFPLPPGFVPIPIPTVWPSYTQQRTRFRSAGFTKVIQRFGVLEKTVAKDLGSVVETKNLAYDAETGNVLVTETTTNFNDKIYTMNYPAYWHYDNMGPAYQNIGYTKTLTISGGIASDSHFVEGDEVILKPFIGSSKKAWVTSKTGNTVGFQHFDGGTPSGTYKVTIIRSGRRNMQTQNMASITTLTNPLTSFSSNLYENVIQASAIEFDDRWRTYCDCLDDENGNNISTNPYVMGTKGNYRPITSYLPLSKRSQSDFNSNTNIRKDGIMESYSPYYYLNNGNWGVNKKDWTYTAEVTEFNPFGQELENVDALGRHSAATFGFNQTLAKSVAANARYREIGFTSFEDDNFSECADDHFKFDKTNLVRDEDNSHTGVHSIKVSAGSNVTLTRDISWCDSVGCFLDAEYEIIPEGAVPGVYLNFIPKRGTPGYIVDWDLISGSMPPNFSINPTTGSVTMELDGTFTMIITWIDSEGCTVSYQAKIKKGNQSNEIIKLN